VFPAPLKSFERRATRASSGERRPLPANRFWRHHEATIRIDIAAITLASPANGTSSSSVELPESAFRTAGGEPVRFIELPPEAEAVSDDRLEVRPDASAGLTPRLTGQTGRRTKLALFASVALHVLAAAALLTWMQDGARIAGGTPSEIAGIGNASMDRIASGEAVNVTITTVPIVKAHAVEAETLQPVTDPAQSVEEAATAEPVREAIAEAAHVREAEHIEPAKEPAAAKLSDAAETSVAVEPNANAAPVEAEAAASVSDTLEILAVPTLSDGADAVPATTALAKAVPEAAAQATSKPVARAKDAPPAEILAAVDEPQLAEHAPLPTPRPERVEKPAEKAEKRAPEPEKKKPIRTAARTPAPGSRGRDEADAKRGVAEGRSDGRAASSNKNTRAANAAGNAAVSNYPGTVVAKLRRALRYPSEARSRRLNGVAQVRFVVGGSGDVGSVGLAASSGSPVLDKAALATVRRAAPFPPIPEGAGRRSWTFTVPLAFIR
jgi:protein TonB